MVVSLGVRPSIRFCQIFKSSDEIRGRNGVLALGTKEFRNLVLLHSEVEVCGPVASTLCGNDISLGRGVASFIIVPFDIDVFPVLEVVIRVFWRQINVVTSGSGQFVS